MDSILQQVMNIMVPFARQRNLAANKHNDQLLPAISSNVQPADTASESYKRDIDSFGKLMMRHIQNGTLTQEALDNAIEENKNGIDADNERKKQAVIDGVDREIKDTYESLPESQRQRFKDNIDRQARIDSKLKPILDEYNWYSDSSQLSWQTKLIANIVKDPELEKLASSIHTKEKLISPYSTSKYFMNAYDGNPLSEPFIALRAQRADTPQAFVIEMIERKKGYTEWNMLEWFSARSPNTTHKDDAYVLGALKQIGLSDKDMSQAISNAFLAVDVSMLKLGNFSSYLDQLTSEDSKRIKSHYVQEFVQNHVVGTPLPLIDDAVINNLRASTRLCEIEFFLNNTMPFKTPGDKTGKSFDPQSLEKEATIDRLANVLLPFYDVNTVATILEVYQGTRALDGSLSSQNLVPDVHTYLTERSKASTFTGDEPTQWDNTKVRLMPELFVSVPLDGNMDGLDMRNITEKSLAAARKQLSIVPPSDDSPSGP